jgi:hypothetical protein
MLFSLPASQKCLNSDELLEMESNVYRLEDLLLELSKHIHTNYGSSTLSTLSHTSWSSTIYRTHFSSHRVRFMHDCLVYGRLDVR